MNYLRQRINFEYLGEQSSAPGTPPSGTVYVYVKTDGLLYRKDDTGTEIAVLSADDKGYVAILNRMYDVDAQNFRILHDGNGRQVGLFRRIPRTLFTHASGGFDETSTPHPAFLVNGSYVDEIWVACFPMALEDPANDYALIGDDNPSNSSDAGGNYSTRSGGNHSLVARSYPNVDPFVKGDWDWMKAAADNLNTGGITGYHMTTDVEWDLLALLEMEHAANGGAWAPGNCDHGRDVDRPDLVGMISESGQVADGSHPSRILTGSMSQANFLGIFDLKGNTWEWTQGKIIDGVLHVPGNTNTGATGVGNSFAADEADWYDTEINITSGLTSGNRITAHRTDIPGLLIASSSDGTGSATYDYAGYWFNTSGERMARRGGAWDAGVKAAPSARYLSGDRGLRTWSICSRLAYIGPLDPVT